MLLHPGVIALILGSGIVLFLIFSASALGTGIMRRWDIKSTSEEQLLLERKTYLISIVVRYTLLFEVFSMFVFIYIAEDIHMLLAGAMCATGSLNANAFGFPALYAKIAAFFASASWVAINHLDNKAEDYPLIMTKYRLLIIVFFILSVEFFLQIKYFLGINPDVITSCCGVMFSEKGEGLASSLSSLPSLPAKVMFYSLFSILVATGIAAYKTQKKTFIYLFSIFSFLFFISSVAAMVSFVSLYFYQIPTHHCPFDILQREYYYIGYPLYAFLFAGSFFGMMTGIIEPWKKNTSLKKIAPQSQKRWILYSVAGFVIFTLIASAPMFLLPFKL